VSLPVPLSVRLGDQHITRAVSDVSFRKEAVGGLRNVSLTLRRDIGGLDPDLDPFTKVYVYDGRTAETVAEARLADSGRSAGADGQAWEVVAFGPVQHASDITAPLIYVDRSLEGWRQVDVTNVAATIGTGTKPGDTSSAAAQGFLAHFPDDTTVATLDRVVIQYERMWRAGQKVARIDWGWDSGITDATWEFQQITNVDGGGVGEVSASSALSTAGGMSITTVVSNWPLGRNAVKLRLIYVGGGTVVSGDTTWSWWDNVCVRSVLMSKQGTEYTTGYSANTVRTNEVVEDLLGRMLPEFDGANAVTAASAVTIPQLAYPAGVTAEQVLADMMKLEPAYRWYTTPDMTGNGYGFRWEVWPTTVRYEVTLDDGGSFPVSAQALFNRVGVTWTDAGGAEQITFRTLACPLLDEAGITRQAMIDLGSEVGSESSANAAGDAFLAEHNVPQNSGTVRVARPIRDIIAGRMVDPWEIEAGELIRVRGVESYPDALNADSNDGQSVFRIWAVDYSSSDNAANLSLDADPADTTSALVKLLNERTRR
jgi:hypothetical protein